MTALNKQALRSKARSASAGEWIKESGDGWEAICSSDDQANGNFIIAHFEGPDAKENREFVQVANPAAVLALLDELEAAKNQIADLFKENVRLKSGIAGLVHLGIRYGDIEVMRIAGDAQLATPCTDSIIEKIAAGIGAKGE